MSQDSLKTSEISSRLGLRRFKPYPAYKDSGVEWLGEMPRHWQKKRLKHVFLVVNGATPKSGEATYWNGDIPWATPDDLGDLDSKELKETRRYITEEGYNSCGASLVPSRSLVLSTRAPIGHLAIALVSLCVNQGCRCLVFRHGDDNHFFYYTVFSLRKELDALGQGSTFKELSRQKLVEVVLPTPPICDQRQIATFLERETAKIDALVAKKERLIELLQEKRAALITHAVTKGLDPSVPMKDSGVEWFGDIPECWETLKFPRIVSYQEGPGIMAADFRDEGTPLLRIANLTPGEVTLDGCNYLDPIKVSKKWSRFQLNIGDQLISASASVGIVSKVNEMSVGAIAYTGIIRLRPANDNVFGGFIRFLVVSNPFVFQVTSLSTGVGIKHYGPTHLTRILCPLPPLAEQIRIATLLEEENERIGVLVEGIHEAITYLKEYRTALISAAVTGKIDVREEVS